MISIWISISNSFWLHILLQTIVLQAFISFVISHGIMEWFSLFIWKHSKITTIWLFQWKISTKHTQRQMHAKTNQQIKHATNVSYNQLKSAASNRKTFSSCCLSFTIANKFQFRNSLTDFEIFKTFRISNFEFI